MAEGVLGGRWGQSSRTTKINMSGVHSLSLSMLMMRRVEKSSSEFIYQKWGIIIICLLNILSLY